MPFILLALLLMLVVAVLIPVSVVQRYRVGTSRRRARGWVAGLNAVLVALSTALFLIGSAMTTIWVPRAFVYSAAGLAAGILLGVLGLTLTRWESSGDVLHYTPNRWLVLGITSILSVRIFYGFWRGWQTWNQAIAGTSWLVAVGVAESLAAGGVVLGYYVAFWTGVRRALRRTPR